MDPITHALTGAAIADALPFGGKLGKKGLAFAMAMGAAPDIDIVASFIASYPSVGMNFYALFNPVYHRTYTHAFPVIFAAAPVLAWIGWRLCGRTGKWGHWWLATMLALCSHTVLDMTNRWSLPIWLPFSNARVSWGLAPVLDPPTMVILGLCFLLNHVAWAKREGNATTVNAAGAPGEWLNANLSLEVGKTWPARLALAAVAARMLIEIA